MTGTILLEGEKARALVERTALALAKKNGGTVAPVRVQEAVEGKVADGAVSLAVAALAVYSAEYALNPKLRIAATPKAVRAARDRKNLRWERIAVRSGKTVAEVRALYRKAGGDLASSYTGKGTRAALAVSAGRGASAPNA